VYQINLVVPQVAAGPWELAVGPIYTVTDRATIFVK
jgi:hypothetical protein